MIFFISRGSVCVYYRFPGTQSAPTGRISYVSPLFLSILAQSLSFRLLSRHLFLLQTGTDFKHYLKLTFYLYFSPSPQHVSNVSRPPTSSSTRPLVILFQVDFLRKCFISLSRIHPNIANLRTLADPQYDLHVQQTPAYGTTYFEVCHLPPTQETTSSSPS
ncbi:hypothetical protein Hypma_003447 [Hypsizygus marmoreus]|uniref:Uncharacterized protein n=1 Tax=Hypsizygus marmoreus TaxID=39966 RepID=A0A369JB05_HYPMA|nr:hypothetical protein Hypma_003447 [Hypsizygus marmoreus]